MPKPSPKYIKRHRLYALLDSNCDKKVTILQAPAGYGKTSLLSNYLHSKPLAIAWITLDESDQDLAQFWSYFTTAISEACQSSSQSSTFSLMKIANPQALRTALYQLIEFLTASTQSVSIVLDDYHLIQNEQIHNFLIQFIEYLPHNVHLYLTARTVVPFPLSNWRVKQWVHELNLSHLKFSHHDTALFLSENATLSLNETQIQTIYEKTEGWVAGILLTTLAYKNEELPMDYSQSFTSEFLWQEIIHKLPSHMQDFLLKTSLLQELNVAFCNELLERNDSSVLLQQLVKNGVFTFQISSKPETYRYHHLFKEALQNELTLRYDSHTIMEIIKKVIYFYESEKKYSAAIELAINYNLYDLAAHSIEEHVLTIFPTVQPSIYIEWLRILRSASYAFSPQVLISGFIHAISMLQFKLAQELMEEVEALQLQTKWIDNPDLKALKNLYIRTKAYYLVGLGNKLPDVLALLRSQLSSEAAPSEWDDLDITYNNFEIDLFRLGLASKGKLLSKEDTAQVIQLFRHTELRTLAVSPYIFAIGVAMFYELNELEEAEKELAISMEYSYKRGKNDLYVPLAILKAKLYIAQGQQISAQAMLQQIIEQVTDIHWKNALKIMLARCYLLNNELEQAQFTLDITTSYEPFWRLTNARLLLKQSRFEEALHTVIQVKTEAEQEEQLSTLIEATVLEAICHEQMNNSKFALKVLQEALQIAAPYGYIRTFLDEKDSLPLVKQCLDNPTFIIDYTVNGQAYLEKLKMAFSATVQDEYSVEPLTPREKEIFKLLIAGAKNREIAAALHLSEGTVRVYISTLYSKLAVTSRVEAILLAQQNEALFS